MDYKLIKCQSKHNEEINSNYFCENCKNYMCKKCEKMHSQLFQNHHCFSLDNKKTEIFTGFCKEKEHFEKLEYFCKSHNKLCCASCIAKLIRKGKGQHTQCDIYNIEDIKDLKKNDILNNATILENLLKTLDESIIDLKKIFEEIILNKNTLKISVQNIFTKIRSEINDREEKILLEIDRKFEDIYFKEDLIKDAEKLPNKIKFSLEKSKINDNDWNDENKLSSIINDCIEIENNIKNIEIINEKIRKSQESNKLKIYLDLEKENKSHLDKFIKSIKLFGNLKIYNPNNIEEGKDIISDEITKNENQLQLKKKTMNENEINKLIKKIEKLEEEKKNFLEKWSYLNDESLKLTASFNMEQKNNYDIIVDIDYLRN